MKRQVEFISRLRGTVQVMGSCNVNLSAGMVISSPHLPWLVY